MAENLLHVLCTTKFPDLNSAAGFFGESRHVCVQEARKPSVPET